ncbi:hypothetical protein CK203_013366 [Vitis vinifera]|uniref:Uncharacterized protein n=1 Tax=Vitis vinifera TaxID=29760 RepID=A0A438JPN7_VITVI|nr:hypothetical protein CK203_013366 [Vitis vinifera]
MLNMMSSNIAIANFVADNIWYLDLRATHHFIPDYSKLTSATPFTRFPWLYLLNTKDEASSMFLKFQAMVQT